MSHWPAPRLEYDSYIWLCMSRFSSRLKFISLYVMRSDALIHISLVYVCITYWNCMYLCIICQPALLIKPHGCKLDEPPTEECNCVHTSQIILFQWCVFLLEIKLILLLLYVKCFIWRLFIHSCMKTLQKKNIKSVSQQKLSNLASDCQPISNQVRKLLSTKIALTFLLIIQALVWHCGHHIFSAYLKTQPSWVTHLAYVNTFEIKFKASSQVSLSRNVLSETGLYYLWHGIINVTLLLFELFTAICDKTFSKLFLFVSLNWKVILQQFPGSYLSLLWIHLFCYSYIKKLLVDYLLNHIFYPWNSRYYVIFAGENSCTILHHSARQVSAESKLTCSEMHWSRVEL